MRFRLVHFATLFTILLAACRVFPEMPARPANVPSDFVQTGGWKASWWAKCFHRPTGDECRVFNSGGVLLWESVYLPYDGGPPPQDTDLQIDITRTGLPNVIYLRNGRILILAREFEDQKHMLDINGPRR